MPRINPWLFLFLAVKLIKKMNYANIWDGIYAYLLIFRILYLAICTFFACNLYNKLSFIKEVQMCLLAVALSTFAFSPMRYSSHCVSCQSWP